MTSTTWPRVRLEELTTKVGSGATPRGGEASYKKSGVPLIRSMNVVFFGFKRDGVAYLDEAQAQALQGVEVRKRDVLLNITGASIGRVTLAPPDMDGARVNQHVCIIRPSDMIDARFLRAFLSSSEMQSEITAENYGVTRQALTKQQILDFEVPLPSLPEQKRIADKLDALLARVDACRERLDRVPLILKRFRQAVLAAAIPEELVNEYSEEEESKTTLVVPLAKVIEQVKTGPFGSALHKSDYVSGGVPVINPMHINAGQIVPTVEMAISEKKAKELQDFRLFEGDVIVARRGMMGRCAVVGPKESGWLCGTGSMVLRPSTQLSPAYLQIFLSSPATIAALEADAVGSTMVNLNQKILLGLEIQIPNITEQNEIVRRVEALFTFADRLEARYNAARAHVERLTPALLAKAFRGELVPQDPNDEPASVLLERIRATRAVAEANIAKPSRGKTAAGSKKHPIAVGRGGGSSLGSQPRLFEKSE